jgi:hypothetical protein
LIRFGCFRFIVRGLRIDENQLRGMVSSVLIK